MSAKRHDLVQTAVALFSEHGFHGTGIDRIAEIANVSKKTMYHHFRSKEELILAALKYQDGVFRNDFMRAVEAQGDTAYERLLAIFDVAQAWFADNKFYGCMFINAVGEYSTPDTPIRDVCRDFKKLMLDYIEKLAIDADVNEPKALAAELSLLLEGSIVTAQVAGNPGAAAIAKKAANVLLDQALTQSRKVS